MRCDSCGSDGECYNDCSCAKCVEPERYEDWKENCPETYEAWLEKKRMEEYD